MKSMRAWVPIVSMLVACSSPENGAESRTALALDERAASPNAPARPAHAGTTSQSGWDSAGWRTLLDAYATSDARFRYRALRENPAHVALLTELVASIGAATPASWSRDEQLAFYINAYNVLVVRTVIDRWPIESVMRSEGFFDGATYSVAGLERTLNALENEVIRGPTFNEPRIHFAVNCASIGCPPLRGSPYTAAGLDAQLHEQAEAFVRTTSRIDRGERRVSVSQLFEWFADDFAPAGGVRAFLVAHLEGDDRELVRDAAIAISHFEYDWALNSE